MQQQIQTKATRKRLEVRRAGSVRGVAAVPRTAPHEPAPAHAQWFKYCLYVSVPLVFGYGLGKIPSFWEQTAAVVGAGHGAQ